MPGGRVPTASSLNTTPSNPSSVTVSHQPRYACFSPLPLQVRRTASVRLASPPSSSRLTASDPPTPRPRSICSSQTCPFCPSLLSLPVSQSPIVRIQHGCLPAHRFAVGCTVHRASDLHTHDGHSTLDVRQSIKSVVTQRCSPGRIKPRFCSPCVIPSRLPIKRPLPCMHPLIFTPPTYVEARRCAAARRRTTDPRETPIKYHSITLPLTPCPQSADAVTL